jgi:hypothetical protein
MFSVRREREQLIWQHKNVPEKLPHLSLAQITECKSVNVPMSIRIIYLFIFRPLYNTVLLMKYTEVNQNDKSV